MFGGQDIRSLEQDVGRQADGEGIRYHVVVQAGWQQLFGHRGAGQQGEGGLVLVDLGLGRRDIAARLFQQGLGLAQVEVGQDTNPGLADGDVIGVLARLQGLLRYGQYIPVGGQAQPSVGGRSDQRNRHGIAIFLGGEEVLQGGFFQAADAAEQVDFP